MRWLENRLEAAILRVLTACRLGPLTLQSIPERLVRIEADLKELRSRPSANAKTYETVNVGGGAVRTVAELYAEPPQASAVRGASYCTAHDNLKGRES